jgi:hypothetical protein
MPAIIDPNAYDLWLDPGMQNVGAASEMLKPYDARLMRCFHNMNVNNVDEIKWQALSVGPHPKHHVAVLFITSTPFLDSHNNPIRSFQWTESDDANGAFGGGQVQTPGTHEYCVAVFDGNTQTLYVDDPKIIVGRPLDAKAEVVEVEKELRQVIEKMESMDSVLKNAIGKLPNSQ